MIKSQFTATINLASTTRLTAALAIVACSALFTFQKAGADTSGFDTNVYGSGGTGYSGMGQDSSVRDSDSNPTGEGSDRAMEKELTPDYTTNQRTSRNDIPFAGAPTTTTRAQFAQLDKVYGGTLPQNLPQTRLDSFVKQSGGEAELIFGGEGRFGTPPYFHFTDPHHINSGIFSEELTTGHHDDTLSESWGFPN